MNIAALISLVDTNTIVLGKFNACLAPGAFFQQLGYKWPSEPVFRFFFL
jgi:hypothetical protein